MDFPLLIKTPQSMSVMTDGDHMRNLSALAQSHGWDVRAWASERQLRKQRWCRSQEERPYVGTKQCPTSLQSSVHWSALLLRMGRTKAIHGGPLGTFETGEFPECCFLAWQPEKHFIPGEKRVRLLGSQSHERRMVTAGKSGTHTLPSAFHCQGKGVAAARGGSMFSGLIESNHILAIEQTMAQLLLWIR